MYNVKHRHAMRFMYNVKHRHAIRSKFGDKFSISLPKLVLEPKASNCSSVKVNLVLYCRIVEYFYIWHLLSLS